PRFVRRKGDSYQETQSLATATSGILPNFIGSQRWLRLRRSKRIQANRRNTQARPEVGEPAKSRTNRQPPALRVPSHRSTAWHEWAAPRSRAERPQEGGRSAAMASPECFPE